MGETEILGNLHKELRLDLWWHDLLGQKPSFDNFDIDKAVDSIPRTEVKAAKAVATKFQNVLSYTEARNQWYLWDGRIHTPCEGDGIAIKIAKLFYDAMSNALEFIKEYNEKEAVKIEASGSATAKDDAKKQRAWYDKGEIAKHKNFRDRVSGDAGLNALIRVMKTECDVDSDYFDNDQRWFVMSDFVLDLDAIRERGLDGWTMLSHDPSRPVTKFFDASYDKDANLGHWDKFLEYSIPSKASRDYLQIVTGAAFMGESKLRTILNLHGPPGSGKSVFINTMFKLGKAGAGYSCMPDSKSIIKVTGQNFEQDSFKGRRFIGVSEPPMGDSVDNEFLKKFTGDEWVETRTLNVKSSGWVPQGVLFVASNKALRINTRDKAIVERVQMIEFPVEFESGPGIPIHRRKVAGLEDLIMLDRKRVLSWIITGMLKFIAAGKQLNPPAEVIALQSEVVTDASTALRWVEDYIEDDLLKINPDEKAQYFIPVKDAYFRYQNWVAMSGEKRPLTLKFFVQDIEGKFGGVIREGGTKRFRGITVTENYRRMYGGSGIQALNSGF
ncbi:DNA helicase [Arthrobacter phage Racecar]|nr:DNA helicase [Arthrobacter phage Racecar]QFG12921.1 DNA helicase [Arthrobacter phage Mimi]